MHIFSVHMYFCNHYLNVLFWWLHVQQKKFSLDVSFNIWVHGKHISGWVLVTIANFPFSAIDRTSDSLMLLVARILRTFIICFSYLCVVIIRLKTDCAFLNHSPTLVPSCYIWSLFTWCKGKVYLFITSFILRSIRVAR